LSIGSATPFTDGTLQSSTAHRSLPASLSRFLDSVWLFRAACAALVLFVLARATLSSIVHDEALTYLVFVKRSVRDIVIFKAPGSYDNNHMLLTLLAKLSVALFGLHELSLRLPSVLAYCLYLTAIGAILKSVVRGFAFWVFFFAAAANPAIIDLMSVARGYGLGISLTTAGFLLCLKIQTGEAESRLKYAMAAEFLFALAVLAHFSFLLLYLALLSWRLLTIAAAWYRTRSLGKDQIFEAAYVLILTAALAGTIIRPMGLIRGAGLFALAHEGITSFFYDTVRGVVDASLYRWPYEGWLNTFVSAGICAVTLAAAGFVIIQGASTRRMPVTALALATYLTCAVAAGSIAQHYLIGVSFLFGRNAVFFAPLICIVGAALFAEMRQAGSHVAKGAAIGVAGFFAYLLPVYAAAENLWSTHVWGYDASTRFMMDDLARRHDPADLGQKSLGTEWPFEPSVNFYREKYKMTWLNPVTRDGPLHNYDYYYLPSGAMTSVVNAIGPLDIVERFQHADNVLAVPAH